MSSPSSATSASARSGRPRPRRSAAHDRRGRPRHGSDPHRARADAARATRLRGDAGSPPPAGRGRAGGRGRSRLRGGVGSPPPAGRGPGGGARGRRRLRGDADARLRRRVGVRMAEEVEVRKKRTKEAGDEPVTRTGGGRTSLVVHLAPNVIDDGEANERVTRRLAGAVEDDRLHEGHARRRGDPRGADGTALERGSRDGADVERRDLGMDVVEAEALDVGRRRGRPSRRGRGPR